MKIQMSVDKKFFKTLFLLILFPICISASPKQGGTLTVPIITPAFTENFNPFTNGDNIKGLMFEPLLVYNSMVGEIDYRLVESFEYSDDMKSILYKLRSNLKWSDGTPIRSEDVVFSISLAKEYPAFDAAGLFASEKLEEIKKEIGRAHV